MAARAVDRSEARDGQSRFPNDDAALAAQAIDILRKLAAREATVVTAESCTGGLLASLLTDQEGLGRWFDRGFVTYTDVAKTEMLGVDPILISRHGAVSAQVAEAMADGALDRSSADISLAITGFAGPAGPGDEVGLVHLACRGRGGPRFGRCCRFGSLGRDDIRRLAAQRALEMIAGRIGS